MAVWWLGIMAQKSGRRLRGGRNSKQATLMTVYACHQELEADLGYLVSSRSAWELMSQLKNASAYLV